MFYYADLSGDTWVVRLNYVVHEVGKNGWAQLSCYAKVKYPPLRGYLTLAYNTT